jgi:hypothetical protein
MRHLFLFVAALLLLFQPAFSDMTAGTAKAVISNTEPLVMVNGNVSAGTLYDLYTRVLVLNDGAGRMVFVANDLNCLDVATPILRERVQKELGIGPERIIILATHNHSAPIQIVPDNFEYGKRLADIIFTTIQQAIANERGPVKLLLGSGQGDFLTAMGSDAIDEEVQLLQVKSGEETIAMLFTHPTHPLQASNDKVEPGHPGFAVLEVERRMPGALALYATSAGGNQFSAIPKEYRLTTKKAKEGGPEYVQQQKVLAAQALGNKLADVVMGITAGEMQDVTGPITVAPIEIVSLPLGKPLSKEEALKKAEKFPADTGFVPYPHDLRDTNWVRMLLRYYEKGIPFPERTTDMVCTDDTYLIHNSDTEFLATYDAVLHDTFPCVYEEVVTAKIGPMAFVAMQGEVCAPLGMRIKEAVRKDSPILLFAYFGEHNLYIPSREIVERNLYQAKVIQIQYASPVPWSLDVEDEMVDNVLRLVKAAMAK